MTETNQTLTHLQPDTDDTHEPTTLILDAEITLIDTTGTGVHTDSMVEALSVISHRHRAAEPARVAAADHHITDDGLLPEVFTVVETDTTVRVEPTGATTAVDYVFEYTQWQLTDRQGTTRSVTVSSAATIAQTIATTMGRAAVITSSLPGAPASTTYHPQTSPTTSTPTEHQAPIDTPAPTTTTPAAAPNTDAEPVTSATATTPPTRRESRQSFLTQVKREQPATRGWRGLLNRTGFRLAPAVTEQHERQDISLVSQHWPGPRVISVVNGKGGSTKTPAVIELSAVLARYGGGGVLAWDNNQTRGTLGWRTEQGPHESTVLDLLPETERLLAPGAQAADLAHFVHHQTSDRFDVLRSKPSKLADEQRFGADDVDRIHTVASKFYRLIIIDSGNDESDPLWRRMIDHTDQLVVATTTSDEKAEAGALLLEDLAATGSHGRQLADNAVVVISQAEQTAKPVDLKQIATGFGPLAREVVTIPFDSAMVDGHLSYTALRPDTQRAWLSAGAAVARGFSPQPAQETRP